MQKGFFTDKRSTRFFQHTLFWLVYILSVLALITLSQEERNIWSALLWITLSLPLNMMLVYFHLYCLVPVFLMKHRYILFFMLFVSISIIVVLFERYYNYYILYPIFNKVPLPKTFAYWNFVSIAYFGIYVYALVLLAIIIKLFKQWFRSQQHTLELENQNKTSELALLRMQINPHFLFNSLNNIHALIPADPNNAADALLLLSDIMRYMLYDSSSDKVPLSKEIKYLRSYIGIQQLRLTHPEKIEFSIWGSPDGLTIAPMLLIPFVENAFKHFDRQNVETGISIRVQITGGIVTLFVKNSVKPLNTAAQDKFGGVGLINVKRRLDLLYPGQYHLDQSDAASTYEVKLNIKTL